MNNKAYTLIELMVAVAILVIVSIISVNQFRSFNQDRELSNSASNLQSFIRTAQTNATTGTLCNANGGATWLISIKNDRTTFDPKCSYNTPPAFYAPPNSFKLPVGVEVQSIISPFCTSNYPSLSSEMALNYAPITGELTFSADEQCIKDGVYLAIILVNTKTSATKTVIIRKGGAVDVE
jgi:prepilin-type N-terminal cleavage/methylation domain-containing protein